MQSKYYNYWNAKAPKLAQLVEDAATGKTAELDVSDIRLFGNRAAWNGLARVHGSRALKAPMAHANALANVVTGNGLCEPYDQLVFSFSINSQCRLRVSAGGEISPLPDDQSMVDVPRSGPRPPTLGPPHVDDNSILDPTLSCKIVHRLLARLPKFTSPEAVPFNDGLYLFYEAGEVSPHLAGDRVVRVGIRELGEKIAQWRPA